MEVGSDRAHTKWIGVARTQLAIPPGTIQLVNRPSFILAWLRTKRACIEPLDSFTQGARNGVSEHRAHVSASWWHSDYIKHFTAVTEEAFYCKSTHIICRKALNTKWFVILTFVSFDSDHYELNCRFKNQSFLFVSSLAPLFMVML